MRSLSERPAATLGCAGSGDAAVWSMTGADTADGAAAAGLRAFSRGDDGAARDDAGAARKGDATAGSVDAGLAALPGEFAESRITARAIGAESAAKSTSKAGV